jgi:hypothetical protein
MMKNTGKGAFLLIWRADLSESEEMLCDRSAA